MVSSASPRSALRLAAAALAGALFVVALVACSPSGPSDADPVRVSVTTDTSAVAPGRSVTLVWRFAIAPAWHLYWVGRNDSGFPPTIDLALPAGWLAGALQWPAPERHLADGDILDHVYFDELVLLQKVRVPDDAAPGVVEFAATVEWLGCKEACVPGKATVPVAVTVSPQPAADRSDAWRAAHDALPQPLPAGLVSAEWSGQVFHLRPLAPAGGLAFMPTVDCGELVNLARDGAGETLALRFQVRDGTVGPVRGLLTVRAADGATRSYTLDFPARTLDDNDPNGG